MKMNAIALPRLTTLSLIVLFGVVLSLPLSAGTQLWDFEEKHDDWEVANGNWEIKGGTYHVDKGGQAEHSLVGEEKWVSCSGVKCNQIYTNVIKV